jgi:hypothetical protein
MVDDRLWAPASDLDEARDRIPFLGVGVEAWISALPFLEDRTECEDGIAMF